VPQSRHRGTDADTFQPMNINFGLMPPDPGPVQTRSPKYRNSLAMSERETVGSGVCAGSGLVFYRDRSRPGFHFIGTITRPGDLPKRKTAQSD
jgi:hypothetical protein